MASNNINDDACCIKMRQEQNKNMVDHQFFLPKFSSSCNASVPKEDAANMYANTRAIPPHLIGQESTLSGRGTHLNRCNVRCPGSDIKDMENKVKTVPELCPIISTRIQNDFCNL